MPNCALHMHTVAGQCVRACCTNGQQTWRVLASSDKFNAEPVPEEAPDHSIGDIDCIPETPQGLSLTINTRMVLVHIDTLQVPAQSYFRVSNLSFLQALTK